MIKRVLIGLAVIVGLAAAAFGQSCSVQAYFATPDNADGARAVLLQSIDGARDTLEIAVASCTDDQLGDAVVRAHRRGVGVRVILAGGREGEVGSEYDKLLSAGVPVRLSGASSSFGHRFAIVDQRTVLTGSYEWTDHTNAYADLVRISCPTASQASSAQAFLAEFNRLWALWSRSTPATPPVTSAVSPVSILSVDRISQCITLFNSSDRTVDLSHWSLSDFEGQYAFPEGTEILPNDPYRVCIDVFNPSNDVDELYFDPAHDEVFLVTPEGNILDEVVW
jgi:phosphatidylserine/phosphatidylglycerophosphate/cardiolipin synthase-like enzyme